MRELKWAKDVVFIQVELCEAFGLSLNAWRMVALASTGPRVSGFQRLKMMASRRERGGGTPMAVRNANISSQKGRMIVQSVR